MRKLGIVNFNAGFPGHDSSDAHNAKRTGSISNNSNSNNNSNSRNSRNEQGKAESVVANALDMAQIMACFSDGGTGYHGTINGLSYAKRIQENEAFAVPAAIPPGFSAVPAAAYGTPANAAASMTQLKSRGLTYLVPTEMLAEVLDAIFEILSFKK